MISHEKTSPTSGTKGIVTETMTPSFPKADTDFKKSLSRTIVCFMAEGDWKIIVALNAAKRTLMSLVAFLFAIWEPMVCIRRQKNKNV